MSTEKERLADARWVLERNLAWIAAAEIKVGVIVAIDTALLGSLGVVLGHANAASLAAWAYVWLVAAGATATAGIFCASMAVLPKLEGPKSSLVFFGCIQKLNQADYCDQFAKSTDGQLLADWTAQIHCNAQIAWNKFSWVRASMAWSFLSVLPWFAALVTLI